MTETKVLLLLLLLAVVIAGVLLASAFYTLRGIQASKKGSSEPEMPSPQQWARDLMRH